MISVISNLICLHVFARSSRENTDPCFYLSNTQGATKQAGPEDEWADVYREKLYVVQLSSPWEAKALYLPD